MTVANDDSPEFRLARGLAFLDPGKEGTGPVRRYLEPVEKEKFWVWGKGGGHVVWGGGGLARNLGAVVVRRLMDAEKNAEPLPPFDCPFPVQLADIVAFLNADTDDAKLEDLLWGLSLVERGTEWQVPNTGAATELPRAYALTKLTLLPGRLAWEKSPNGDPMLRLKRPAGDDAVPGVVVKPEPAIPAKLRAGDVQGACEVAARRLRSSGFSQIGGFRADGVRRAIDWSAGGAPPERLLAALLFPIPDHAVSQLAALVLRFPSTETLV